MENYVHFLINNGGKGYIYIEERNAKESKMLEDLYYKIKSGGTSFIDEQAFRDRLIGINFLLKSDDNAGLQLADFVPNSLNRHYSGLAQKELNVFNQIIQQQYDGGHDMPERFGVKKVL